MGKVSPHKCLVVLTTPLWRYLLTPVPLWMDSWTQAANEAIRSLMAPDCLHSLLFIALVNKRKQQTGLVAKCSLQFLCGRKAGWVGISEAVSAQHMLGDSSVESPQHPRCC